MKRILFLTYAVLCMMVMFSCGKDENGDGGLGDNSGLKGTTWTKLAAEHPFLNDFPSYDNTIDNYTYTKVYGVEQVGFFDYNCAQEVFSTYADKLATAGFEKEDIGLDSNTSALYSKTVESAELTVSLAYSAGSFAAVFANIPK